MTTNPEGATRAVSAIDRMRAFALLKRYGWNATSFQILEPGFRYWFDRGDPIDACVAYVDTGASWVAAGPPIAPAEQLSDVAHRFVVEARALGRRACFFATESRFIDVASFASMRIGEQPVWNPVEWERTLRSAPSLREQLRRSRAKGVLVEVVEPRRLSDPQGETRAVISRLIDRWLASRPMQPMGFLVQVHLFTEIEERRFFTATWDGRLVGLLSMVPVYARAGWLVEDLIRAPEAPNGTSELLVDAAMRLAMASGSRYVTLGLAPLAGPVSGWLKAIRRGGLGLYDFRGLQAFKAKLRPESWKPIFISYPAGQGAITTLRDALSAFASRGLLRFGVETLLRGPSIVVRGLALTLVPWTILLATADSSRWFPSITVKWAWVVFDACLAAALMALARRWRNGLDTLLALLVSADAAVTLAEAAGWNLRHQPFSASMLLVLVLASAAPSVAALVLWRGRAHRADLH
jgi:phosphatidylglycerol lysyltransferase